MGKHRAGLVRDGAPGNVFVQLALCHLLLFAIFLSRPLLQLLKRILPALRRESGQTRGVGREQLRQDLQLAFLLQRLSRRTSFPTEGSLDEDGNVPPADRGIAKRRRHARYSSRAYAWLP